VKTIDIFSITLALIVCMSGCFTPFHTEYELTISSTEGGSVTNPGEGIFTYCCSKVVNLTAEAEAGCRFINWTGDVGTISNVEAAATNITVNGDYSITANFVAVYNLTISSTIGGNVTTPGEGTFTYDAATVVNLVATPDAGYQFGNWIGDVDTIVNIYDATTTIAMNGDYHITAYFEADFMVTAGAAHTVGLKSDGTVVATDFWQSYVGNWTNIVQVAAGGDNTAGLESDGTVVAVGFNSSGQCNVNNWTDIIQVDTNGESVEYGFPFGGYTVGLKSDGTVVAAGDNTVGQCNIGSWTNIVQIVTGVGHTVGLKSDGTVVAVGDNSGGQCNVGNWTNIIQVCAGGFYTVGLKADGTVVAVGMNDYGQCDVSGWTDIVQVAAGCIHTLGLKSDSTVVAVGDNTIGQCDVSGWTDIIQVAAGCIHTAGLKSDGTVVAVGDDANGRCEVEGWDLN